MPRLKWLMFHMPMSSPQRIRIFGFFAAMIAFPFSCWLIVRFDLVWPAREDAGVNVIFVARVRLPWQKRNFSPLPQGQG